MVHVFVPNRHSTGISVRCMRPYDEYRQFTPNPEGGAAAMQRCLITASRRTANANGDTDAAALMFGSLYFILIKYQLAVKLAMLELMCCVCVCVCVCYGLGDIYKKLISRYLQNLYDIQYISRYVCVCF